MTDEGRDQERRTDAGSGADGRSGDARKYDGRVALVTGTRKGLGRLLAEHFLDEGAQVIGLSRGEASIERPGYEHYVVDIGEAAAVRTAFLDISRAHERLDIAVNNAAALTSIHALLMSAPRAEEMVRTNLLGTFYVSREAAKLMRKGKFGRIINIGSMAAALEPIGDSVYAATKAASMTLMGVLAKEFAEYGIMVNTVSVSAIETDMLDKIPRDKLEAVVAGLALPRLATPADVFNVIDFFASSKSSYITAQTVFLGGVHT
jgi:3-oxoacyl-[acyl-carrier protein] reductase